MVGQGSLQLFERVVACQDSTRPDIAVTGGLDVMFHVPDKKGFVGAKMVIGQDRMDGFPLIDDSCVGFVKIVVDPKAFGLMEKILSSDTAQKKSWKLVVVTVLKNFFGSRQKGNRVVVLAEDLAEYLFEAFQGNSRQVFFVKALIGEVELFTKGFPVKKGLSVKSEYVVCGCNDRREVVD